MAKSTRSVNSRQSSTQRTSAKPKADAKPARKVADHTDLRTPIEYNPGEPDRIRTDVVGDLDKETLEPSAPYNKTYGIKHESSE